jgi:O-antigen biosynthesis protein WbqP
MKKRCLDLLLAAVGLIVLAIPMFVIAIAVRMTSKGPALHWSKRVGRDNRLFWMPKFRSMRSGTPQVATHLLTQADSFITPLGKVLRVTSLDELPQLLSVFKGDMSFVGPRPALFNQDDLIELRTSCGVHRLRPGVTGWAQVNGRDLLSIPEKVEFDRIYLENLSLRWDMRILLRTVARVVRGDGYQQASGDANMTPQAVRRAA